MRPIDRAVNCIIAIVGLPPLAVLAWQDWRGTLVALACVGVLLVVWPDRRRAN